MKFILVLLFVALSLNNSHAGGLFECETDSDCPATSSCKDYLCTCPLGQIISNDGSKCLPLATKINAKCEISEQCGSINGETECREGLCFCKIGYVYLKGVCIKRLTNQATCTHTDDCFDGLDYNSRSCVNQKCECNEGYYSRGGLHCRKHSVIGEACIIPSDCKEGNCIGQICQDTKLIKINPNKDIYPEINENYFDNEINIEEDDDNHDKDDDNDDKILLGEVCNHGDVCTDTNAHCSPIFGTCSCNKGYFVKSKKCVKELGMPCTAKSECPPATGVVCEKGICNCAILQHYHDTNTKCRKTFEIKDGALKCSAHDSCKIFLNDFLCAEKNLDKFCKCERGYKINEEYLCEYSCMTDDDCTSPQFSVCSELNKCECPSNSELIGNKCVPRISGICKDDSDCQEFEINSKCSNDKCVCNEGFVSHDFQCYKLMSLGDTCDIHEQCTQRYNATCSQKKHCGCVDGFVEVNGNCYKMATKVGDYCNSPFSCMSGTICEKSKCLCPTGMRITPNRKGCQKPDSDNKGNSLPIFGTLNIFLIVLTIIML